MNLNVMGLLTAVWLMDRNAASAVLRDVIEQKALPETDPHPAQVMGYDLSFVSPMGASRLVPNYATGMAGYDPLAMAFVQVINIEDTLTPWYADWKADQFRRAFADESVMGVVVKTNCIGGTDQAAYMLTDVLGEKNKPVVFHTAYGNMNSSMYWTACGGDRILAGRSTDRIGGIGIYIPFLDSSGYLEKMGYKVEDVYAPESTEKNAEYRAALEGDFKPYQAYASEVRTSFINYVQERRGAKLNPKAGDPFKGATYNATDALALGLIDEIGSFERAVEICVELALATDDAGAAQATGAVPAAVATAPTTAPPVTTTLTSTTTPMAFGYLKLEALASLKNKPADQITAEQITAVNAELKAANIPLALISESDFTAGVQASEQVIALNTELTTVKGQLTTAQAEVTRLGTQPGATPTEPKGATDPAPAATGQPTAAQIIAALPHNVALDNNPFFK